MSAQEPTLSVCPSVFPSVCLLQRFQLQRPHSNVRRVSAGKAPPLVSDKQACCAKMVAVGGSSVALPLAEAMDSNAAAPPRREQRRAARRRQQQRWRPFIMAHAVAAALYCCLLRDAASIEYCGASHSKAGFATSVSAVSTQEHSSKPSTSMAEQEAPLLLHYSAAVVSKNYEQSSVGCCTLQRSHGRSDSPQGAACALVNRQFHILHLRQYIAILNYNAILNRALPSWQNNSFLA